jgi:hypothetical protein
LLAFKLITQAIEGEISALNTVLDRVEGKAHQSVEIGSGNGGPVEFQLRRVFGKHLRGDGNRSRGFAIFLQQKRIGIRVIDDVIEELGK